jgi:hypothetical protein
VRSRSVQYSALVSGHGVAPSVPLPTARPVSERSSTPAPLRSHPPSSSATRSMIFPSGKVVGSSRMRRPFSRRPRRGLIPTVRRSARAGKRAAAFKIAARVELRSAARYFVLAFAPDACVFFGPLVGPALFCRFIPPVCWLPDDPPSFDFLAMAKTSVSVRADETRRSRVRPGALRS